MWSDKELALIKELGHSIIDRKVASILTQMRGSPVSIWAVKKMRQRMGIEKRVGRPKGR